MFTRAVAGSTVHVSPLSVEYATAEALVHHSPGSPQARTDMKLMYCVPPTEMPAVGTTVVSTPSMPTLPRTSRAKFGSEESTGAPE